MFFILAQVANDDPKVSLWTLLIILAIVALLVFIFRNVRR